MTKQGTLDDLYFEWLYGFIGAVRNRNPARSHWELARQLYTTQFVWSIPNDDNREGDGKDLRNEFVEQGDIRNADVVWMEIDCSMLEMIIALARHASFQAEGSPLEWFWKILDNLSLYKYTDDTYTEVVRREVADALDKVNNRTYDRNGVGGLFPLVNAHEDQRKVELWYQMASYLLEGENTSHRP